MPARRRPPRRPVSSPLRISLAAVAILGLAAAAPGCFLSTEGDSDRQEPEARSYLPLDRPENVVNNLIVAWREHDLERYRELLAPEFEFRFTPAFDTYFSCADGVLPRDDDLAAVGAIFGRPDLERISLGMSPQDPVPSNEVGLEHTRLIRVDRFILEVDLAGNLTWSAHDDLQEFFVRPGFAGSGEDTTRWYLALWRDEGSRSAHAPGVRPTEAPTPVRGTYWWQMKCELWGDAEAPDYLAPTSPENQVENLARAWAARDLDGYAGLLPPEFRFYFQDGEEPAGLGTDYWTRSQDLEGSSALFGSPEVLGVRVHLAHGAATPATEVGMPEGTMRVRVSPTEVEVGDRSGITYRVYGDIQDLFFRPGRVQHPGEDPGAWYLIEWRDISAGGGNGAAPGVGEGAVRPAIRAMSWGRLKTLYE